MTRFFSNKPNSYSHIYSPKQDVILGRFTNGVFDTEDRRTIEELTKRFKSQLISEVIDVVSEEIVDTVELPEIAPTAIEEEIKKTKEVIELVKEDKPCEYTEEELKKIKMPELLEIYKSAGYTYKVGLKKVELIKQLLLL